MTLLFEDGSSAARVYRLPPFSRSNVPVGDDFGAELMNTRFGALVETSDDVPVAVERAMNSDSGGVHWAAGTNALATKLQ